MRTFINIVRVIITIPLFILLAIVLIVSPLLISFKFTVFNSEYIKNLVSSEKTLKIVEENVFKNTQEEGADVIKDLIFGDTNFLKGTLNQGVDSIFIWLKRDSEEISITADRSKAEDKYLNIAYLQMEKEIQKELGKNIDLSTIPLCKKNLSNDELKIRFIDGVPCMPIDLKSAINESFKELGLSPDNDSVTLFQIPREKLDQMNLIRSGYWVVENSIPLTIGAILTLLVLIVLISPKTTTGYIVSGIFTFIVSTANLAIFSYIPYFEIDNLLARINIERNEITKEVIREAYDKIFSRVILDIADIGKEVTIYLLITATTMLVGYIIYRVIKKKRADKEIASPELTNDHGTELV